MKKPVHKLFSLVFIVIVFASCVGSPGGEEIYEGMDRETKIKMEKYYVQGKLLFKQHCQNCHKEDGKGLGKLIPPLAGSDYLMGAGAKVGCFIKYGQQGPIVVNGIEYNQPMPANKNLSDLEIAEIITYISNSWGNKKGLIDVSTTNKALQECKQ